MNIPELPDKSNIASEINRIMDEKGVTIQDLSDAMIKPRTTIYNIKKGFASYDLLRKTLDTLDKWEAGE
jgi:predicted transcriptional regulator